MTREEKVRDLQARQNLSGCLASNFSQVSMVLHAQPFLWVPRDGSPSSRAVSTGRQTRKKLLLLR
jgi:hypothetical protein